MAKPIFKVYDSDYDNNGDVYVGKNYRHWNRLFNLFRKEYPELWDYGTQWTPYHKDSIRIVNPKKGEFIYRLIVFEHGQIEWIRQWKTDEDIKKEERLNRPGMYQNFLREISRYQENTRASQGHIAMMTGLSRKSINKYLSGTVVPKVSTMRQIAEKLNLDI